MVRVKKSFLFITLLSFIYALFSGGNLPYSIFYALFLLMFLMGISTYLLGKRLYIKVEADKPEVTVGEDNKLVMKIYNEFIFPITYMELENSFIKKVNPRDRGDIISLRSNSQKFIKKSLNIKIRGQYYLGETKCSISDIFGIFSYERNFKNKYIIKVYPKIFDIHNVVVNGANLREFNTRNIRAYNKGPESSETIKNIREYRRGDSYKRINWKVSAKHGKLFIKEYDSSESPRVHFFLDLRKAGFIFDKDGVLEERLVEYYLSLIRYIIKDGGNCEGIIINNEIKAFDVVDQSSFELLREYMVGAFSGGDGSLAGYIEKYIYNINKKSAMVIVTADISKDNLDYLISLKQDKYEVNLFYLEKVLEDNDELISHVKGYGIGCYSLQEVR